MTNLDKFKEIFGDYNDIKLRDCDGFCCANRKCRICERKDFWEQEYIEKQTEI